MGMGNSCPEIQPLPRPSSLIWPILIIFKSFSSSFLSSYAALCCFFPSLRSEQHPLLGGPLPFSPSSLDGPSISVSSSVPPKSNRFFPGVFLESSGVSILPRTQHIHPNLAQNPPVHWTGRPARLEFILRFRAELWGLPDLFCGLTIPCSIHRTTLPETELHPEHKEKGPGAGLHSAQGQSDCGYPGPTWTSEVRAPACLSGSLIFMDFRARRARSFQLASELGSAMLTFPTALYLLSHPFLSQHTERGRRHLRACQPIQ